LLRLIYVSFGPGADDVSFSPIFLDTNSTGAAVMRLGMSSGSFAVGVAIVTLMIPCFAVAEEVPQSSNRSINSTGSMWIGFAVSPNRRVFKSEANQAETSARDAAKKECEATTLRSCKVIAVPAVADVSAVSCTYKGRSESFLGASTQDAQKRIALDKANSEGFPDSSCVEFFTN
jgi:hypothetical protein